MSGGDLETSVYCKPTSTIALLNWDSSHPLALKKGIPKRQYLRLRWNCSTKSRFLEQARELRTRFREKGNPDKILRDSFHHALSLERSAFLTPKQRNDDESISCIIGTYDEAAGSIRDILTRHWGILNLDPDLRDIVGLRPQITYRKGPSLRDRLMKSHVDPPAHPSNWLTSQMRGCYHC